MLKHVTRYADPTLLTFMPDTDVCCQNSLYYLEKYSSVLSKTPFDGKGWTFDYNLVRFPLLIHGVLLTVLQDYIQLDTDNCGVHVCMLAYMMAVDGNADEWNGGKVACREYRELILGVIHAYCKKVYVK